MAAVAVLQARFYGCTTRTCAALRSLRWPLTSAVCVLAIATAPHAESAEILVKFESAQGLSIGPWAEGDPSSPDRIAMLHREAGAREAVPLATSRRADVAFEQRGLGRISLIRLTRGVEAADAITAYEQSGLVEYAVPNHEYQVFLDPADSLEADQWGLAKIRAREGWATERGSRDVLVAIVDTGVDYLHPDLAANIWVNETEDLNGDGAFDPVPLDQGGDLNGIDDDGNGFVDDVIGWDFADAPELPGSGDWLDRDNDPMDEGPNSHGTHVAGIACAVADNGIGVAGVAPGCRVMALRAGFGPTGYLQEDDVSSAIIYAVQNGASVVNMSWGDVVVSPVIKDVLAYAHAQGCVLVASAGNSATDAVHYPSGYEETISVGNSTSDDQLASSSSFGPVLDVVAPGSGILSTFIGGYGTLSGTSMAAPHVSGLAALVRSRHPEFSNEEIRTAIKSGAIDLGSPGRDNTFGAGRIDVARSLAIEDAPTVHVSSPVTDAGLSDQTTVVGTAAGLWLARWELSIGAGLEPLEWTLVASAADVQVVEDTLGVIDVTGSPEGRVVLRLAATDMSGTSVERLVPLWVDRTPPVLGALIVTPVLEGPSWHHLLEFETDDITSAVVWLRTAGSEDVLRSFPLRYQTTDHRWLLGPDTPGPGHWEFHVTAENGAGLISQSSSSTAWIPGTVVSFYPLHSVTDSLPPGYVVPEVVDFDGDGLREIAIGSVVESDVVSGSTTLGPMRVFEATPALGFREAPCDPMLMYPLCAGDSDGDQLTEILGTYAVWQAEPQPEVFFTYTLWEPRGTGEFPGRIAWSDSSNLLGLGTADADGDGWGEVYSIVWDISPRAAIAVAEAVDDDQFAFIDTLLASPGRNADFVQRGMTHGDLDGDGSDEVVFCDNQGNVSVFRSTGNNSHALMWSDSTSFGDRGFAHAAQAVDVDGDGVDELAVLCRLNESFNLEHNFDARRWSVRVFRQVSGAQVGFWETILYGAITETAMNSLGAGDIDGDGREELAVCAYPDFYLFTYDSAGDSLRGLWYLEGASSSGVMIADLDGAGGNELVVGFPDRTVVFGTAPPGSVLPPGYVKATPVSISAIDIEWSPVAAADAYRLYRGLRADSLELLSEVTTTEYTDTSVGSEITYWYAVSTVDTSAVPSESEWSGAVSAATNPPPMVVSAEFVLPHHVVVHFSEAVDDPTAKDPGNYSLLPGPLGPTSSVLTNGEQAVMLSFARLPAEDGPYTLAVNGVRDLSGIPVPTGTSIPVTIERHGSFYVERASYLGEGVVSLAFNAEPDSSLTVESFSSDPPLVFGRIEREGLSPGEVRLILIFAPGQADGTVYTLSVSDACDVYGNEIQPGVGSQVSLTFFAEDLLSWRVAPNPFRPDGSPTVLRFVGVPQDAVVGIWDMAGRLVQEVRESSPDGAIEWDGRSRKGTLLPSGVYIYRMESSIGRKTGRIVAIR